MSVPFVIIICSLIFLFLFSLSLFAFIIFRRIVLGYRRSRFMEVCRGIEKDILEAITLLRPEFSLRVARLHQHHPAALTRVLLDFSDAITGEGREHLRLIFDHAVKERCLKAMASRRTAKRLQNTRLFIIFFDPGQSFLLYRLLGDKPIIRLAVINALSRVPSPETLAYIFEAFEKDSGYAVRSYFNIMFSLGNRIEPLVKAYLGKALSVEKLGLLVELIGAIPLRSLGSDIIKLAGHADKEIRIRVARAMGKLLLPESVEALITLSSDEAWEVKAQAVKGLGKLQNRETIEILVRSLFSPHWYVRHNAGYGLAEMGEPGIQRLKEVASQNEDKYARDMSAMVLNELLLSAEAA